MARTAPSRRYQRGLVFTVWYWDYKRLKIQVNYKGAKPARSFFQTLVYFSLYWALLFATNLCWCWFADGCLGFKPRKYGRSFETDNFFHDNLFQCFLIHVYVSLLSKHNHRLLGCPVAMSQERKKNFFQKSSKDNTCLTHNWKSDDYSEMTHVKITFHFFC